MSTSKSISIVIPVRNEAGYIAAQLQRLQAYRSRGHELIVIDGGSLDDTVQLTTGLVDSCESGESGRSRQMNQGAASAWEMCCYSSTPIRSCLRVQMV